MRKGAVKDGEEGRPNRSGILEFAQDDREIRTVPDLFRFFWDWFSCRAVLTLFSYYLNSAYIILLPSFNDNINTTNDKM